MLREYVCKKCKEKFEFIEEYKDNPDKKDCPKCNSKSSLEVVLFSLSSFQLKGSGWFKTGGY